MDLLEANIDSAITRGDVALLIWLWKEISICTSDRLHTKINNSVVEIARIVGIPCCACTTFRQYVEGPYDTAMLNKAIKENTVLNYIHEGGIHHAKLVLREFEKIEDNTGKILYAIVTKLGKQAKSYLENILVQKKASSSTTCIFNDLFLDKYGWCTISDYVNKAAQEHNYKSIELLSYFVDTAYIDNAIDAAGIQKEFIIYYMNKYVPKGGLICLQNLSRYVPLPSKYCGGGSTCGIEFALIAINTILAQNPTDDIKQQLANLIYKGEFYYPLHCIDNITYDYVFFNFLCYNILLGRCNDIIDDVPNIVFEKIDPWYSDRIKLTDQLAKLQ